MALPYGFGSGSVDSGDFGTQPLGYGSLSNEEDGFSYGITKTADLSEQQARLTMMVIEVLKNHCPVLSGNMLAHTSVEKYSADGAKIAIRGPYYDVRIFKKYGRITRKYNKKDTPKEKKKTDYATWVNTVGAFGHGGKDVGWVNIAVFQALHTFASMAGAVVIEL